MNTILEQLYGLKRDRSGGHERPYKPALLLAVLDQLETGAIGENEIKLTAGLIDPHHQEVDSESRAIGEDVCELFCSYEETDRIHEFLGTE